MSESNHEAECLVMIYGDAVGRRHDLDDAPISFGRDDACSIPLDSEHVSREHARVERDGIHRYVVDLNSTNGTFVNDKAVTRHRLQPGDEVQIGEMIFKYLVSTDIEAAYYEEIYRMALTDGLTGIANARRLDEFLEREFARSRRHGRDLSVLLLDLDRFADINERLGHVAGDLVLREFSQLIARRIRRDELFARYSGEAFAIVLPESNVDGATAYAEILREMVEAHEFVLDGTPVSITVSIGVATFDPQMTAPADLVQAADGRLYQAKQGGRNRVVV